MKSPIEGGDLFFPLDVRSGNQRVSDVSVAAQITDRFALEAGYADYATYKSALLRQRYPTAVAVIRSYTFDLRGFRVTPVVRLFSSHRVQANMLGGLTLATGQVIEHDRDTPQFPRDRAGSLADVSYHIGFDLRYAVTNRTQLEARIMRYDFGRPSELFGRITAMAYTGGVSWKF